MFNYCTTKILTGREEITTSVDINSESDKQIEAVGECTYNESTDCSVENSEADMTFISSNVPLLSVFKKVNNSIVSKKSKFTY